jgi:hypothetical protein
LNTYIPIPTVMPVDRKFWLAQLNLSNFLNTSAQYEDIQLCGPVKTVLEIGPGQGLSPQILKWKGYEVKTLDIDETFNPDFVGSVHDLGMFRDRQFDVVIVSHVLEHLAVPYLDKSLDEIARVANYALIYLPVAGRHCQLRFTPAIKGIDISIIFDIFNRFIRPDGLSPRFCQGQHFWEVGYRGFTKRQVTKKINSFFEVLKQYRNKNWNCSYNFVLKSRSLK